MARMPVQSPALYVAIARTLDRPDLRGFYLPCRCSDRLPEAPPDGSIGILNAFGTTSTASASNPSSQPLCSCYSIGLPHIVLCEDTAFASHGTTGLRTWGAALALVELLSSSSSSFAGTVAGSCILELGAGTGALGIFCRRLGAASVCMTDASEHVLDRLDHNIALNLEPFEQSVDKDKHGNVLDEIESDDNDEELDAAANACHNQCHGVLQTNLVEHDAGHNTTTTCNTTTQHNLDNSPPKSIHSIITPSRPLGQISAKLLNWEWATKLSQASLDDHLNKFLPFDILLGADIVYSPDLIPPLVHTIAWLLKHQHARSGNNLASSPLCLIASTCRNETTFALFTDTIQKLGLVATVVDKPFSARPWFHYAEGLDSICILSIRLA